MGKASQSREVLTTENGSTSSESGRSPGCYVSKKAGVLLSVFFLGAVMSTAMLVYYLAPQTEVKPSEESQQVLMPVDKSANQVRANDGENYRLPTAIAPESYVIRLQAFINGNFTFDGHIEITMNVLEATSNITLHMTQITAINDSIKVNPSDDLTGPGVAVTELTSDLEYEFFVLNLAEELQPGTTYVLTMDFIGYLNDQLHGFYRSQYTNEDNSTTWLAATQFESTDARKAFPCFDEPAMKATFEIYLARETNMTAISNMPLADTVPFDDGSDWVWDHFDTSLPMSTYLVAFAITDFINLNSTANDHVLFRVWARKAAANQIEYALAAGPAILTHYEEYFSIPFPLPKQDMIALPDFSAGAMENWGLITYRETALLYDPVLSSESNKLRVVDVIAHELAHQWFGDLVTMEWWTDIWLNEGFATYVEYIGTDFFEPTWGFIDQFVINDLQPVFIQDSLESSHPISQPAYSPAEIDQLFDSISYSKGACVLRMLNHSLTEETFRAGLTNYLNAHQYGNAQQDDLWSALTEQAHADGTLSPDVTVKTIMDTWTLQMGYPVLSVVNNGDGSATLTQERFLILKNPSSNDTHDYKWWIPLSYTSQESPDFNVTTPSDWIPDTDATYVINGLSTSTGWVLFNLLQTYYYRVNYEPSNWQMLIDQLLADHMVIGTASRSQLIDDSMNFARAGQLDYDIALDINSYLDQELDYVPWNSALENLGYIEMMFTRKGGYSALRNYILTLLTPLYDSVGFEDNPNDSHIDHYKRSLATSWACALGMPDCVDNSVDLFNQWMADPTNPTVISPNLKSTVYCTAIAEGSKVQWDFAWGQYETSNLAQEKDRIIRALGCSRDLGILAGYLDMAFDATSGIRRQDARTVYNSVAGNDVGRDLAWNYLRENTEMIADYMQTFSVIGDMAAVVAYEFNTNVELTELEMFKEQYLTELGTATSSIDQAIERTINNIEWMDNYYEYIFTWLQDNGYGQVLKKMLTKKA